MAMIDRWYGAFDSRDLDALCALSDPEIRIVPYLPLLIDLPGANFHGHEGLRSFVDWTYETYPRLFLESKVLAKVPGWIRASLCYVVDDRTSPIVRSHAEALIDVDRGRVRLVRGFLRDSDELEAALAEPVLTTREREIFELLAQGMTGPEIANKLVLSPATVRTHVQNGVSRLGATGRLHALAIAAKRGEINL
jgi:DNA-binding CsgD family transcriptional regulator